MKKNTMAIGALLLTMNCFSQTDTLDYSVSGKCKFEFKHNALELKSLVKLENYEDFKFKLKKDEFLYLDLFDGIAEDALYFMEREITVYFRNGETDSFTANSESNTLEFNGNEVKKIIVHKPKEK